MGEPSHIFIVIGILVALPFAYLIVRRILAGFLMG
jgi:hypothetical protein